MSLLDTLKAKLNPDLFAQVTDALGDDFDYDLVTRSRLNAVIGQREAARRAAARQQMSVQSPNFEPDSEPGAAASGAEMMAAIMAAMQSIMGTQDPNSLIAAQQNPQLLQSRMAATLPGAQQQSQVMTKEQQEAAVAAEVQKQVNQVKQQYAITEKLREANIIDPTLVLNGGLLDTAQLKWSEADPTKLESGLEEQLTALKESRPYLFQQQQLGVVGTGRDGVPGNIGSVNTYQDFTKLPYDQQLSFKQAHPEVFQGFMQQAGLGGLIGGE